MSMKRNVHLYRKIWIQYNGPIPKDPNGRSYEIHHIDGNHQNNDISNLKLVTLKEHYDIHYQQEDFQACVLMSFRMGLSPEEISTIRSKAALKREEKYRLSNNHPHKNNSFKIDKKEYTWKPSAWY